MNIEVSRSFVHKKDSINPMCQQIATFHQGSFSRGKPEKVTEFKCTDFQARKKS